MTDKLDLGSKLDFDKQDIKNPYKLISEIASQVEAATHSFVKCEVSEYAGPIDSYYELSGLLTVADVLSSKHEYNIQKDLGEIGSTEKKYIMAPMSRPPAKKYW